MLDIPEDEIRALDALNRSGVRYMLIGGVAMRFYGLDREIQDVDLLVSNSSQNADKLYAAIKELVGHPPAFKVEDLQKPLKHVSLSWSGYQVEMLTSVEGLDFDDAYRNRREVIECGLIIPVASPEDLLFIKQAAAKNKVRQEKELKDIAFLRTRGSK